MLIIILPIVVKSSEISSFMYGKEFRTKKERKKFEAEYMSNTGKVFFHLICIYCLLKLLDINLVSTESLLMNIALFVMNIIKEYWYLLIIILTVVCMSISDTRTIINAQNKLPYSTIGDLNKAIREVNKGTDKFVGHLKIITNIAKIIIVLIVMIQLLFYVHNYLHASGKI